MEHLSINLRLESIFHTGHATVIFPDPPYSPDLNPIEHVWKVLKERIGNRVDRPKNVDELWVVVQDEWSKIDINLINDFVDSMPDHVNVVYNAKGKCTRY